MTIKIAVPKTTAAHESRVAATPETVKKLIALGAEVSVEKGAGTAASYLDDMYKTAGAKIGKDAADTLKGADLILSVQAPCPEEIKDIPKGALVLAMMSPFKNGDVIAQLAKAGVDCCAMEFMPRITRAQSMDVLSSQANLAGYKAVLEATSHYTRAMPMMMTAAGTIAPAKVFIMGAGVAGLQAIATARRLGAVVSATDVRPAVKEQVQSLGASFVAVEDDEFKEAETAGGYAKEMSKDYQKKQQALIEETIAKQDIVITTALIPGRPAPKLVSEAMVKSMKPGSVVVDLAAEQGGNCECTEPGKVVQKHDVTIVGTLNLPGRLATDASALYAKNLYNLVALMVDKESKKLVVNEEDEIIKGILLTRGGKIVHERLTEAPATPAAKEKQATTKKASAKKTTAKKTPAKKATSKKSTTKKATSKTSSAAKGSSS